MPYKDPSAHLEEKRIKQAAYRKRDPRNAKSIGLKGRYGITIETWDAMLISQCGRCGCCGDPMVGAKEPCVDHRHDTGQVRELLCGPCNLTIGNAKEDTGRLKDAILYLERHKE